MPPMDSITQSQAVELKAPTDRTGTDNDPLDMPHTERTNIKIKGRSESRNAQQVDTILADKSRNSMTINLDTLGADTIATFRNPW